MFEMLKFKRGTYVKMDNLKLIQSVRPRMVLYDKTDPNHCDKETLQREWEEIADELHSEVETVKKRWGYLRDYFRKQQRVCEMMKMGRATSRKTIWPLYEHMAFLLPFSKPINMDYEGSENDIDFGDEISEESANMTDEDFDEKIQEPAHRFIQEDSFKKPTSVPKHEQRKRKRPFIDYEEEFFSPRQKANLDETENEHFLKSILPMMKTLEPLDAMEFRHEVQGLLISYVKRARAFSPAGHVGHAATSSGHGCLPAAEIKFHPGI